MSVSKFDTLTTRIGIRTLDDLSPSASVLREFDIAFDGSVMTAGRLVTDLSRCPEPGDEVRELALLRDTAYPVGYWGYIWTGEPFGIGAHVYLIAQQKDSQRNDPVPTLLSEMFWDDARATEHDAATPATLRMAALIVEGLSGDDDQASFVKSQLDNCIPVISHRRSKRQQIGSGSATSAWLLPSPSNGMDAHSRLGTIAEWLDTRQGQTLAVLTESDQCCAYLGEDQAGLMVHQQELEPDPSGGGTGLHPRLAASIVAADPDNFLHHSFCYENAVRLRKAGYLGRFIYSYPTCHLINHSENLWIDSWYAFDFVRDGDKHIPGTSDPNAPFPAFRTADYVPEPAWREGSCCATCCTEAIWPDTWRSDDLVVAGRPIPGVSNSAAVTAALDTMDDFLEPVWRTRTLTNPDGYMPVQVTPISRLRDWELGWYIDTLFRGAREVQARFPHYSLPLRTRILIAAYHLDAPHPLYDTQVLTRVGDRRLVRDLWWYSIDHDALRNGEPFLSPLPGGPPTA